MNIEIQSAEIRTNITHAFTFSHQVVEYFVGFSKFFIKYKSQDHHIKEISINLTNISHKGNEVMVKPRLKINDTSNHEESGESKITVVVIAAIGSGNPNIHIVNHAIPCMNYFTPLFNVNFIKSSLSYCFARYPAADHHLEKYLSNIKAELVDNTFYLDGETLLHDHGTNFGHGTPLGSVIIYNGIDNRILVSDFDSEKVSNSGKVSFGRLPINVDTDDYKLFCFVNGFEISYKKGDDHHVKSIEVGAELIDRKLVVENGEAFANLRLKSFLNDNAKNSFNIPHNKVSGFVIAINNKELHFY